MSVKNIELYKRVLEAFSQKDAMIENSFYRIYNWGYDKSMKKQTKNFMSCTDSKSWILEDNVHSIAFGYDRVANKKQK